MLYLSILLQTLSWDSRFQSPFLHKICFNIFLCILCNADVTKEALILNVLNVVFTKSVFNVIWFSSTVAEQLQWSCSTINHVARTLSQKLYELKDRIQNAVVSRVVEDFIDISSPLKHFTDAVHVPQGELSCYPAVGV